MSEEDVADLGGATPLAETDRALKVLLDTGEETWIPKSVIDDDSECYSMKSGEGTLLVKSWWAKREGLV